MNNKFSNFLIHTLAFSALALSPCLIFYDKFAYSATTIAEPVEACIIASHQPLNKIARSQIAQCLGWENDRSVPICSGFYQPIVINPPDDAEEVQIFAQHVSLFQQKRSTLKGQVQVQQGQRVVTAKTAYVYRDTKTNKITKIEFVGNVRYMEPNRLMIAQRAAINPQDNSGETEDVLYRFNVDRKGALLPAWGRASFIKRFPNKDYLLNKASYTTCAPKDKAWDIQADSIKIDDANARGVARNARLRIRDVPILYTPYLSFPTSKERKSGFLTPIVGYSNVSGYDIGLPYYWNIAPNYDLTFVPHVYSERGLMLGGEFRYLTPSSMGMITGNILPNDRAYTNFINGNQYFFPGLQNSSTNRWTAGILDYTNLSPNLRLNINAQQVSDPYYFQDFSTSWSTITERQILRQADLVYTTDNWVIRGMGQSYQTLLPINEIPVANIYERLPQVRAQGFYDELLFNSNLNIIGQYDQFFWPGLNLNNPNYYQPQGPRFHANPILSIPNYKPWGYFTPAVQLVENYYQVQNDNSTPNQAYNLTLPRVSIDSGLFFDRDLHIFGTPLTQTLEPRVYYLYVPYRNQTPIPVYDSGYMIFDYGQLFRDNRFSGFDRIGDANQIAYALTSRWLYDGNGAQLATVSVGQLKYFSNRQVQLCQSQTSLCLDNPNSFAYLSPTATTSPIAAYGSLNLTPVWSISSDYVFNTATRSTNNTDVNVHYQPQPNRILSFGYSYLENGDVTAVNNNAYVNNSLNQGIVSFAWPLTDRWSTLGAYSHNISKNYDMMSLLGFQYDSCCWAMRVLGGRVFKNLNAQFQPQYNNNIYVQILLKGLGSVANSDPTNILSTYIPGYYDPFSH